MVGFVSIGIISAQEIEEPISEGNLITGNGISVTPVKIQRNYSLGESDTIDITLLNNEEFPLTIGVNIKSFKLINNNQNLFFEKYPEDSILSFINNFENRITLEPKQRYNYKLNLTIPNTTLPAGYSFALMFESIGSNTVEEGSNALIKQSVAVPILINIAGVKGITFGELTIDSIETSYNLLSNSVYYQVVLKNNSNQYLTPIGIASLLKNSSASFGPDKVDSNFNRKGLVVSPFSSRVFSSEIYLNQLTFGEYQFSLNILYGLENNVVTNNQSVFIIPIYLIIIIGVIVIIIFKKVRKGNNEK